MPNIEEGRRFWKRAQDHSHGEVAALKSRTVPTAGSGTVTLPHPDGAPRLTRNTTRR
jgi:hypothetical protein